MTTPELNMGYNNGEAAAATGLNNVEVADNAMDLRMGGEVEFTVARTLEATPSTILTNEDRAFLAPILNRMKKDLAYNKGLNTNAPSMRPGVRFGRKGTNHKAAKRHDPKPGAMPNATRQAFTRLSPRTPGWGVQFLLLLDKSPDLKRMLRKRDLTRIHAMTQRVKAPAMNNAARPKRLENIVLRGNAARRAADVQLEGPKPAPKAKETLENKPEPTLQEELQDELRAGAPAPKHRGPRPYVPVRAVSHRRGMRPVDQYRLLRREWREEQRPEMKRRPIPRSILALSL